MAKKRATTSRSTATPREIQKGILRLDQELVRVLNERAKLERRLAKATEEGAGGERFEGDRQVMERAVGFSRGPLDERTIRSVFRELLSGIRTLIQPRKVAYLGPMYSYSHLAAVERFGQSAELIPVATIAAVFEELNRGHADYGLVPIENSTDGRVVDTLDMFARLPIRICGEVQLRIHHHLLGKCTRAEVQEVYSKPQALSQCRDWLAKHLPLARTIEMTSTAAAAQLAAERPGAAAIASLQAGVNYGLNVIAENIEDNKYNVTRFAVIGDDVTPGPRGSQQKCKTSLMFEILHRPGALADAMSIFKRNRLNLTWIESFPMTGSRNEYLFFVELEGHHDDSRVQRALTALKSKTVRLEILGSYARCDPHD